MSVSENIAQEDNILREIRLSLSTYRTLCPPGPIRKGAIYASAPITSGRRLYQQAQREGFVSTDEFKRAMPDVFKRMVFLPNLKDGEKFGRTLQTKSQPVIVPGKFFGEGWRQEHYMSLWRQVIVRHARTVAMSPMWHWSLGCTEEFLIAIQHNKHLIDNNGDTMLYRAGLREIRGVMDVVDKLGFDVKPHYELWRQATLTLDA